MNKIRYIFARFDEMYRLFVNKGKALKCLYFIDWCFSLLIDGASIYDYFAYDFFHLRFGGRKAYITFRKFKRIQDRCNRWSDFNLLRDKSQFNELFADMLGRKSLDLTQANKEQFVAFCKELKEIFVKDAMSLQGKGISTYTVAETDLEQLYDKLKAEGTKYLIEERIVQCKELAEFHPSSINTLRVVSVYDDTNDTVTITTACFRMGNNGSRVDNFCSGGILANINVETGLICTPGYNEHNDMFYYHPFSGKQILGYKIPHWEECKQFIREAAKRLPTVRYVGWDLVELEDVKFLLIEGNNDADFTAEQTNGPGLWPMYDQLTKHLKPVN